MNLIERVVADDPTTLDLLDRAMQRPPGGDQRSKDRTTVDNINSARPDGTAKAAALRKLRKDAPELHAKVLANEMSAHVAMVKAGFRHRTITIRVDDVESIVRSQAQRRSRIKIHRKNRTLGRLTCDLWAARAPRGPAAGTSRW
jgi:hypothetical protein